MNDQVTAILRTLPRRIKVGAYDWRVVIHDGPDDKYGEADFATHHINLWPENLIDGPHAVGVVIHELLHVIYGDRNVIEVLSNGDDTEEHEEGIVLAFENGIVSLYRDNPKLLTWIKRGFKSVNG
jgi:hypothetical protein